MAIFKNYWQTAIEQLNALKNSLVKIICNIYYRVVIFLTGPQPAQTQFLDSFAEPHRSSLSQRKTSNRRFNIFNTKVSSNTDLNNNGLKQSPAAVHQDVSEGYTAELEREAKKIIQMLNEDVERDANNEVEMSNSDKEIAEMKKELLTESELNMALDVDPKTAVLPSEPPVLRSEPPLIVLYMAKPKVKLPAPSKQKVTLVHAKVVNKVPQPDHIKKQATVQQLKTNQTDHIKKQAKGQQLETNQTDHIKKQATVQQLKTNQTDHIKKQATVQQLKTNQTDHIKKQPKGHQLKTNQTDHIKKQATVQQLKTNQTDHIKKQAKGQQFKTNQTDHIKKQAKVQQLKTSQPDHKKECKVRQLNKTNKKPIVAKNTNALESRPRWR